MKSKSFRKYINSMRLKTSELPECGYIGLHFTMTRVTDRSEFKLPGHVLKMEGSNSRLIIVDPAFYKNRDTLIAYLARMYTGMADNTLKVYALPNIDTAVDLVSMAYQEISSAYVYKLWLSVVKSRRTTPTFSAVTAALMADQRLSGWKNTNIAAIDGGFSISVMRSQEVRILALNKLCEYANVRSRKEAPVSSTLAKEVSDLPGEIKVKISTRTGRHDGKHTGITVSRDTTPPTVHPIPDGYSVQKMTKEDVIADMHTGPVSVVRSGRVTKKEAVEQFIASKRNMLKAIREHEDVVMRTKALITG